MIRYLIFAVILVIAVLSTVWLVSNPGEVSISWLGWHIDTYVPILIVGVAFLAAVSTMLTLLLRALIRLPKNLTKALNTGSQKRKETKAIETGKEEAKRLYAGFAAVWAGNHMAVDKLFNKHWRKTISKEEDNTPIEKGTEILQILLYAKCSEERGETDKAIEAYKTLLFFTDIPRDFGIDEKTIHLAAYKGLIDCEHSDVRKLEYASEAFAIAPEIKWTVKSLIDLQINEDNWIDVYNLLKGNVPDSLNAGRYNVSKMKEYMQKAFGDEYKAICAMVALQLIYIAENPSENNVDQITDVDILTLAKEAYDNNPTYVTAATVLAQQYSKRNKLKKALAILSDAWSKNPDMIIANTYIDLLKDKENKAKLSYIEKLVEANPNNELSDLFIVKTGFEYGSWDYGIEKLQNYVEKYGFNDDAILIMAEQSSKNQRYNEFTELLEEYSA
jgi:HemY protein